MGPLPAKKTARETARKRALETTPETARKTALETTPVSPAGTSPSRLSRRAFLEGGTLVLAGFAAGSSPLLRRLLAGEEPEAALKVGLVTDIHYADKPPAGTRHYRLSLGRLEKAVQDLDRRGAKLAVEIGDFVDAAPTVGEELRYLETIEGVFARFRGDRHYVLGNHCVHTLTKEEFLGRVGKESQDGKERKRREKKEPGEGARKSYYSFDAGGFHFVILDACFRSDGVPYGRKNSRWNDSEIPPAEREWLVKDLRQTSKKTLVFVHQRIDVDPPNNFGVKSAPLVRQILERSGKVRAVFQGHNHLNDVEEIGGIHYVTLPAIVDGDGAERNAYGVLDVYPDGTLRLEGFGEARSYAREQLG